MSITEAPTPQRNPRVVYSADWYSDLNATIAAALANDDGAGVVWLSKDTSYSAADPMLVSSGLSVVGEDRLTSIITATGDAAIQSASPLDLCEWVTLRNFSINQSGGVPVGLDARGMTRLLVENFYATNFTDTQVWWGGDDTDYAAGWTNVWNKGQLSLGTGQTGIRYSGLTGGGSAVANHIAVRDVSILVANDTGSIGIDLQQGDGNLIEGCDVGYGADGLPFKFGTKATHNRLIANRSESSKTVLSMLSGASRNVVIGNYFGGFDAVLHPVTLALGAQLNMFFGNTYDLSALTPHVNDANGSGLNAVLDAEETWLPMNTQYRTVWESYIGSGGYSIKTRRTGEDNPRFAISEAGNLNWINPTTNVVVNRLNCTSVTTGRMSWMDDGLVAPPKAATSLPGASSSRRGCMMRVEGGTGVADGLYICVKDAADAYSWKLVTLA